MTRRDARLHRVRRPQRARRAPRLPRRRRRAALPGLQPWSPCASPPSRTAMSSSSRGAWKLAVPALSARGVPSGARRGRATSPRRCATSCAPRPAARSCCWPRRSPRSLWANVAWPDSYESFWTHRALDPLGDSGISEDLRHWVNDGPDDVLLLRRRARGRREFDMGELRERRRLALPVLAALGGMAVPIADLPRRSTRAARAAHGWGAAMSTDTAFALGVLALVGPRCPTACACSCSRSRSSTTSSRCS